MKWEMIKKKLSNKTKGNVMDFLTVGIILLAVSIVVMASFYSMELMLKKLEVSQVARKYILVMETKGCLDRDSQAQLCAELEHLGMREIDITGTTVQPVEYGDTILLNIKAKVTGSTIADGNKLWSEGFGIQDYYVEEKRMSTAKN